MECRGTSGAWGLKRLGRLLRGEAQGDAGLGTSRAP